MTVTYIRPIDLEEGDLIVAVVGMGDFSMTADKVLVHGNDDNEPPCVTAVSDEGDFVAFAYYEANEQIVVVAR